jgi:hypothetical protein
MDGFALVVLLVAVAAVVFLKFLARISAKHFDFVICNSSDLVHVVVIELDDSSHQKAKRQQRDEMLQQICGQVQLPLIRVPAQKGYKLAEVEEYLKPLRDLESTTDPDTAVQGAGLRAVRDDSGWVAGM